MIQFFNVHKRYPPANKVLVNINLKIEKGEYLFITGASGVGKTTLLRLMVAAETPSLGQIVVDGRNLRRLWPLQLAQMRQHIGFVFQDFKLIKWRTIAQNVGIGLEVQGYSEAEVHRRSMQMLERIGLLRKAREYPPMLSGGEKQRVAVARALVTQPRIVLADEPTANLDKEQTEEVMQLFAQAHAQGTTVVVATHNRALFEKHGERALLVYGSTLHAMAA